MEDFEDFEDSFVDEDEDDILVDGCDHSMTEESDGCIVCCDCGTILMRIEETSGVGNLFKHIEAPRTSIQAFLKPYRIKDDVARKTEDYYNHIVRGMKITTFKAMNRRKILVICVFYAYNSLGDYHLLKEVMDLFELGNVALSRVFIKFIKFVPKDVYTQISMSSRIKGLLRYVGCDYNDKIVEKLFNYFYLYRSSSKKLTRSKFLNVITALIIVHVGDHIFEKLNKTVNISTKSLKDLTYEIRRVENLI
jgi:hypothetical protein